MLMNTCAKGHAIATHYLHHSVQLQATGATYKKLPYYNPHDASTTMETASQIS